MTMHKINKAVLLIVMMSFSGAACAAPTAPAGYNPEEEIALPPEEDILRRQQEDFAAMDAQATQIKALQDSAEETETIRQWEKMDSEITLRKYDQLVFNMRKDFDDAKRATNPFLGEQGYVIYPYGEVIPIITCRPMRMTDIALEPGESITGIHAGDTMRWLFEPSQSMKNGLPVSHIVVKPSQPGISTNLLVHTDRRTYNLDFTASEGEQYIRGAAFSYPTNDLTALFTRRGVGQKKALEDELQSGFPEAKLDGLYTRYKIASKSKVDWKPDAVFDDGLKTYIRMPSRFSETPALYVLLDKKETLTNYRVKGRYYIVDRLFDRAYLKIGARRVAIVREEKLSATNIRESREEDRIRRQIRQNPQTLNGKDGSGK